METARLEPPPPAAAPVEADPRPTLLVCDDEEGPRQSLRIVFRKDYRVLIVNSGPAALDLVRRERIDVAVLDILLEGMSGIEVLREIKEIDPTIEVIMLTAYETVETARQAVRHNACDYLNKPFDIHVMRDAVKRALEKRQNALSAHGLAAKLEKLQYQIVEQQVRAKIAETKGEIYASVLHDINSPLTVIGGFVQLLNHSVRDAAAVEGAKLETLRDDLSHISGEVNRCYDISRRYLSFLRGETTEEFTCVGVRQMLSDLRDLLSRHPSAQGHKLTVIDDVPDIVPRIDSTDLLQILLNLSINALQCTSEPHRVVVKAQILDMPVTLQELSDGLGQRFINREGLVNVAPLIAISIEDDGPGITADNLEKMFREKFTTKPEGKGTGLGLSIVHRLAEKSGVGIQVRTMLRSGSTFTVFVKVRN
jgi:signal transduction histidine kinase